ncbi:alpha-(1,3)-fucosyltransferase C [Teleopsis dalmanni]|uniref:alpha-(1,3)-fucosyltransferase C n=1 Tax=Teleopsis dalmanni TaxID=139649 RepID=UPI0018CF6058|nr:alpha-(1,3)-fucosyltransferase C [Teleopsis dalmanni]
MQKALDPTTVPLIERATNPLSKKYVTKMFYHRRRTILICCILCSVLVFLFVMGTVLEIMPEFNQYRLVKKYAQYPTTNRGSTRTILFWNSFFGNKRWSLPEDTLGPAYFRDELLCPVYKCEITNVKDFLPSVDMYDAIVFHTAEPFYWIESVPAKRADNQFYVFALMEPPGETKHVLNDENYFYNLTMTYRLDSDILWPYMYFFDKTNSAIVAPTAKSAPIWREPPDEYNNTAIWNLWSGKNKTAAWFVSHCNTLSQREQLAEALKNFVDVDIYGECGDLSCPYKESECDEMLDKEYKFYLSFENSLCRDYVMRRRKN